MNELENLHQPYGETWHFRRRVPEHVRKYDKRTEIKSTLKTKDLAVAIAKRDLINVELDKIWNSLLVEEEKFDDPIKEYLNVIKICKKLGIKYIENKELLNGEINVLIRRLEMVEEHFNNKPVAKAALGLVEKPEFKISFKYAYKRHLKVQKGRLQGKNREFIRKWKNPRKRAIRNFIKACGDISIFEVNFAMGLKFRNWWLERIEMEGLNNSTANKDMVHLWSIMRDAGELEEIKMSDPFVNCKLTEENNQRPSFSLDEIFTIIHHPGLKKEHPSYRELIIGMAEGGCRDSEIVGLDPDTDVILESNVPHLVLQPNKFRDLKNKPSRRKVPLTGYALDMARETKFKNLEIFKHSPDLASTEINKYLRNEGLLPTDQHSLYSFRHSFRERLDAKEAPETIIRELMGHSKGKFKYGKGTTIDHRSTWMEKISLKAMAKTN